MFHPNELDKIHVKHSLVCCFFRRDSKSNQYKYLQQRKGQQWVIVPYTRVWPPIHVPPKLQIDIRPFIDGQSKQKGFSFQLLFLRRDDFPFFLHLDSNMALLTSYIVAMVIQKHPSRLLNTK